MKERKTYFVFPLTSLRTETRSIYLKSNLPIINQKIRNYLLHLFVLIQVSIQLKFIMVLKLIHDQKQNNGII